MSNVCDSFCTFYFFSESVVAIDIHSIDSNQWLPATVWLPTFFNFFKFTLKYSEI